MTRRPATWLGSLLGIGLLVAGVLSGAVSAEAMLVAAWLENLSAGAATVVALLRAPGGRLTLSPNVQVSGIPVRTDRDGTRSIPSGCAVGFFVGHFGVFTTVHGVFIGVIAFGPGSGGRGTGLSGTALLVVLVAAGLRALRRVEPQHAISQAYAGLVPVHVAVIALFATTIDLERAAGQRGPALLVVGLLLVGDLIRARIGSRAGPPADPPAGPPRSASPVGPTPPPPPAAPPPAAPPPAAPPSAWPPPTGPPRG